MRDRLEPGRTLDRARDHQRAHPGAGGRVVVDVDEAHAFRLLERGGDLEQAGARAAERRVELDRDDELVLAERARKARLALLLAEGHDELALARLEPGPGQPPLPDRRPDRRRPRRRRSAAAA